MRQNTLFRLMGFVKRYRLMYVGVLLFMIIGIGVELSFAWFLMQITDSAVLQDSVAVTRMFYYGIGIAIAMGIQAYGSRVLRQKADGGLQRDIKNTLFSHVLRLPMGSLQKMSSGDLVSRFTNDINSMGSTVGTGLLNLMRDPLMGIAAFVYLFQINWVLAVLTGAVGPLSILFANLFGKAMRRNGEKLQALLGDQNAFLTDVLMTIPVVKAFTAEKRLAGQFSSDNDDIVDVHVQDARLSGGLDAILFFLAIASFLVTLGIGGIFVAQGTLTVGSLMAFLFLIDRITRPFHTFSHAWGRLQRSLAAGDRIFQVLDTPVGIDKLPSPVTPQEVEKGIEFAGVHFSYDGDAGQRETVLQNFTATINRGDVIALVGPSGAGKTTVFNLLLGFWKPEQGHILIDGKSIGDYDVSDLRSIMTVVPQETALFRGSIRDNIAFGRPDATDDEIVQAARMANADRFIADLPDQYDTLLGEGGQGLSGGQRQRIAIARALLKDAPILLMDEATSALDLQSEAAVQEALARLMHGRTTLIIAHRLTTVHHAKQILVLNEGQIVERGNHEELMQENGLYARLYQLQFRDTINSSGADGDGALVSSS